MRDMGMITNDEPVERLFTQGMVIKDGAKMSKSLGNIVSPDDMVARYGADAARMYSLFAAPPDRDLDWQDSGIEGIQRFLGRVYRFVVRNAEAAAIRDWRKPFRRSCRRKRAQIQRKLHQTIKRVTDDFQGRWHFNTCISAIMELVNELYGAEEAMPQNAVPAALLAEVQRNLVLLLAPFAPYLAHELWEMLGEKGSLLQSAVAEVRSGAGQGRRDRDSGAGQRQAARPRASCRRTPRRIRSGARAGRRESEGRDRGQADREEDLRARQAGEYRGEVIHSHRLTVILSGVLCREGPMQWLRVHRSFAPLRMTTRESLIAAMHYAG